MDRTKEPSCVIYKLSPFSLPRKYRIRPLGNQVAQRTTRKLWSKYNKYPTNETLFFRNGAGQPHHPQAHTLLSIQPPSRSSSAVALFAILTARHVLRNFAVEGRSFFAMFPLSVRRLSSLPSVSCATLTGDATYDLSKRGFPVRRRYVWLIKHHR